MSLTRIVVEASLVRRLGPGLARADMSTDISGTNLDLADPIAQAISGLGYTPAADILDPQDSDLIQVADADIERFLLVATRNTVVNIIGNLAHTDERFGTMGQWNSQYAKQMERYLMILNERLEKDYGIGLPQMSTGTVRVITNETLSEVV